MAGTFNGLLLLLGTILLCAGTIMLYDSEAECYGLDCRKQLGEVCWYDVECTNLGRCNNHCAKQDRYARKGTCQPDLDRPTVGG